MTEAVNAFTISPSKTAPPSVSVLLRYQYWFLGIFIAAIFFDLVVLACHLPLGTDELMARISAESSSVGRMLTLLRDQPVNVDAPVFPVLAYYAARLPLPIDLAIRFPAIIAMCITLVAVFLLVRDLLGAGASWIAVGLLSTNAYSLYGAIARPYALLLAGVALTVLCWQRAIVGGRNRRLWLIALSFSSAFALLSHYFAAVSILAVILAELSRCLRRRAVDWPVWGALGWAALMFIPVYLTFAPAGQPYRVHPFDRLNGPDIAATYADTINIQFVIVLLLATILPAVVLGLLRHPRLLPFHAWVVAVSLALGPVLLFMAGRLYTHTYATRYGICAVLGIVIIVSALINLIADSNARILVPAFVLAFALYQAQFIKMARLPIESPRSSWAKATPELLRKYSDLPLVIPDFDYAMRSHFYAPPWLSARLVMIANEKSMLQFTGTGNPALAMLAIHRWTGWPLVDYFAFCREHKRFLMYGGYWALDAFKSDGAEIQQLGDIGPYHLYLVNLPPI